MSNIKAITKISLSLILLVFAIFTFNYFSFPVRGAIEISSCTSITEPGEYVLVNNISSSYESCIYIGSSDVVLDCQGYEIYSESGYVIFIYSSNNVTVKNCALSGSAKGIVVFYSDNVNIYNSVVTTPQGVEMDTVTGASLENISFYAPYCSEGPRFNYVSFDKLKNIYIEGYFDAFQLYGVYAIGEMSNITLIGRLDCDGSGLFLMSGDLHIRDIYISNFSTCVYVSNENNLIENLVLDSCIYGIDAEADYNTFRNNIINADCAIFFDFSSFENIFYNNIINATTYICGDSSYIESSVIYFNTTLTPGENIVGGSYIGGNYWTNPAGNGYSDTCSDADGNGICDEPFLIYSNGVQIYDYLPLAKVVPFVFSVVFGYDSVNFGTVLPSTIAEMKGIEFNVTVSSTTDYKVMVNATDWSGPATIPANTLYFAVAEVLEDLSFIVAKQLSDVLQTIAVFPSTVSTNYHAYYFNVPLVPPGTYTATITITYEVV